MSVGMIKLGAWQRYVEGPRRLVRNLGWREYINPSNPKTCNLCGFHGAFAERGFGTEQCPMCKSAGRHRLWVWYFAKHGTMKPGLRVLHLAPEATLGRFMQQYPIQYETADLYAKGVTHKIDLQTQVVAENAF